MSSIRLLAFGLIFSVLALVSVPAYSQVSISVGIAPPPLIVETQPLCPDDGYLWTPGYWAYDPDAGEYYWVPGTWVQPPQIGFLWTPCYWGWGGNAYVFHSGYWGSSVGFYGGINYGYGYSGRGYNGGRWQGGHFAYNTAANNVSAASVNNTYRDPSAVRSRSSLVSYNGGHGGLTAQPTSHERLAAQQNHVAATAQQQAHFQTAAQTRSHQVKVNTAVAGGGNNTHAAPAVTKQNAAFTSGDTQARKNDHSVNKNVAPISNQANSSVSNQSRRTAESSLTGEPAHKRTETATTVHHTNTSVTSQHAAPRNPEVASTHHAQQAAPTHTAQAAVHPAQHFNAPAAVHHSQASAPQIQHASAPHMAAPHASAPNAGGGGHPQAKASGGNKQH